MITVLVADDHAIVRKGLRQILSETPDIVVEGEAASAPELMPLVRGRPWDAVVLDLNLHGVSGLELLTQLRTEYPQLPVLILTMYTEEQYAVRCIRSGASGFLTKASAPERLIEAIRRIVAGGRYVTPEVADALASFVSRERLGDLHERLSNREFQILRMIGSGKTVSEIAASLYLSVKTVSTHRTRLLAKMEMKTNAELTHYAVKKGLVE